NAAGAGALQIADEIAERRVAILDTGIRVCRDVGGRHRLHQSAPDIRRSCTLSDAPPEAVRVTARQVRIEANRRQRFWHAIGDLGPDMLNEPAERLRCERRWSAPAYEAVTGPVERIEKTDTAGSCVGERQT